jgi:hypothetical protein
VMLSVEKAEMEIVTFRGLEERFATGGGDALGRESMWPRQPEA